jgi:hypothetical protein
VRGESYAIQSVGGKRYTDARAVCTSSESSDLFSGWDRSWQFSEPRTPSYREICPGNLKRRTKGSNRSCCDELLHAARTCSSFSAGRLAGGLLSQMFALAKILARLTLRVCRFRYTFLLVQTETVAAFASEPRFSVPHRQRALSPVGPRRQQSSRISGCKNYRSWKNAFPVPVDKSLFAEL